jgi:hypothetical protein
MAASDLLLLGDDNEPRLDAPRAACAAPPCDAAAAAAATPWPGRPDDAGPDDGVTTSKSTVEPEADIEAGVSGLGVARQADLAVVAMAVAAAAELRVA